MHFLLKKKYTIVFIFKTFCQVTLKAGCGMTGRKTLTGCQSCIPSANGNVGNKDIFDNLYLVY